MGQQLLTVHFKLAEAGRNCFLAVGACPWQAVGTAPVPTLTARALRPAACHLARPHLFFQVSTSGVKSSSPAANPPWTSVKLQHSNVCFISSAPCGT